MPMNQLQEVLKARFGNDELKLAASIGEGNEAVRTKIERLFEELDDPLLTAKDVHELLALSENKEEVEKALQLCVTDKVIEQDQSTHRPLDEEGTILYRKADGKLRRLKLLATASRVLEGIYRLQFTIDGRLLRDFASIDRLDAVAGTGNQRDEIIKHVKEISNGMKAGVQVPNSVILVFRDELFVWDPVEGEPLPESWVICRSLSEWVKTPHPSDPDRIIQEMKTVELDIPYRSAAFDGEKTALLVDGQQRTAALSILDVDQFPTFALTVNAVIADESEAKSTFQVANSTVRISTEFSRALLGSMDSPPGYLKQEQMLAKAVKILAIDDKTSPFFRLVKHPGVEQKKVPVAYNTLFATVSQFNSSGLPFEDNAVALADTVKKAFDLAKKIWPDAWGLPPSSSKLMHGAGLRSVGRVLVDLLQTNYKMNDFNLDNPAVWSAAEKSLARLATKVQWTPNAVNGTKEQKKIYLEDIERRQNTNQDIEALGSFLLKEVNFLDKKANQAAKTVK